MSEEIALQNICGDSCDFIRAHMEVLAGTDFFTVEAFTLKGLVTYYVLFFIQLETRRVCLAGITPYPDQQWMEQQAPKRNDEGLGFSGTQSLPAATIVTASSVRCFAR